MSNLLSRTTSLLPCSGSSQIPVGRCVRALSALSSPRHGVLAGAVLLPGLGYSLWHSDARMVYTHSDHCGPAYTHGPRQCHEPKHVLWCHIRLAEFICCVYFWLYWVAAPPLPLSLALSLIHFTICLVLFNSWSDFCKVCNTGEKWGQVTEEEASYPFSVISVFLNHWHHSGAFGEWVPGQVQFLASRSVSSICMCAFPYSWISALVR